MKKLKIVIIIIGVCVLAVIVGKLSLDLFNKIDDSNNETETTTEYEEGTTEAVFYGCTIIDSTNYNFRIATNKPGIKTKVNIEFRTPTADVLHSEYFILEESNYELNGELYYSYINIDENEVKNYDGDKIYAKITITDFINGESFYEKNKEINLKNNETTKEETTEETTKTPSQELTSEEKLNNLSVEYMGKGRVQYKDGKYTILFGFQDKNKEYLYINATVDVTIKNDDGQIVYNGKHQINKQSFSTWSSDLLGEFYLASIVLNESDITKGTTKHGTILLDVTMNYYDVLAFDDYSINISELPYDAPSSKCYLALPELPKAFNEYDWNNNIESTIKIQNINVEWSDRYNGNCDLTINLVGEKTYGESGYTYISYKLYDSNNYVVDSGKIIIGQYSLGDKFNNEEERFYDLTPGQYRLELFEYSY